MSKRLRNDNGYSMLGLVATAAIIPILAIGSYMGYGYLSTDNKPAGQDKTINEILEDVEKVKPEETTLNPYELENN